MKKLVWAMLFLVLSSNAFAATLRIATITPENSDWMRDMRASAAEIEERTDGRVEIKYFGGGIQGTDETVLNKIRLGALQGGAFTPSALSAIYPDMNLYGLPLVFNSEEEAAFVRERMDATLEQGLEDAGYVTFGFAAGGFAVIMSNDPVTSLEDMEGQRVWVPEGDNISYAAMEALNLSPVSLPLTDVLTGLQTGLIDIVAISPIGALVLQWHTRVKYVTEMPLVYTMGLMVVDKRAFDRLSDGDQAIVREVMSRTYENFDRVNLIDNREARDALLNTGIELVPIDDAELNRVREVLAATNVEVGEQGGFTMSLYEEMLGHIDEYRQLAATVENAEESIEESTASD